MSKCKTCNHERDEHSYVDNSMCAVQACNCIKFYYDRTEDQAVELKLNGIYFWNKDKSVRVQIHHIENLFSVAQTRVYFHCLDGSRIPQAGMSDINLVREEDKFLDEFTPINNFKVSTGQAFISLGVTEPPDELAVVYGVRTNKNGLVLVEYKSQNFDLFNTCEISTFLRDYRFLNDAVDIKPSEMCKNCNHFNSDHARKYKTNTDICMIYECNCNKLEVSEVVAQMNQKRSVLNDWVMELGLREQGTLLTAIRGCDLAPKYPLDSVEKTLTAFIRFAVMFPFDAREIDSTPGCFMQSKIPADFKPSSMDHYPSHYVMHLVHALEVIGYKCPHSDIKAQALKAYFKFVKSFHLNYETVQQMTDRLSEDRIANNNIVEE